MPYPGYFVAVCVCLFELRERTFLLGSAWTTNDDVCGGFCGGGVGWRERESAHSLSLTPHKVCMAIDDCVLTLSFSWPGWHPTIFLVAPPSALFHHHQALSRARAARPFFFFPHFDLHVGFILKYT